MDKKVKRLIIIVSIVLGVLILVAGAFFLKFYLETKEMTPAETNRINDSLFCIKDKFVNSYVFKGKQNYLIVDAGFSEETMLEELHKLNISPEQITTILLTHTDGDHIGAVGLFKKAKVYMHKDEEQMIDGRNGKYFFMKTKWKYGPYNLLNSNDTLSIDGLRIKIIHTPGHSPGSSCYLINDQYLLTGDNVAYVEGKFEHFNNFFNMNTEEQETSIKKLSELNSAKHVLTSHHGIINR